jgi:hypothetical protein
VINRGQTEVTAVNNYKIVDSFTTLQKALHKIDSGCKGKLLQKRKMVVKNKGPPVKGRENRG